MSKIVPTLPRRRLAGLALAGAAVPALGLPRKANAAKPKIAGVFYGSVTEGNWDPPGYAAFKKMAAKHGFETTYVDGVTYEKTPAILRQLAASGVDAITLHSSGYASAAEDAAKAYPHIQFLLYSYAASTDGIPNYSAWSVDWDEFGFLSGAVAAASSKAKYIGVVPAEEIPSMKRAVEFISKGAKYVVPDVKVETVYVGSFSDVAKAKEIATDLITRGADVLVPQADTADAGTQQAAAENDANTLGVYIDQAKQYPDTVISSAVLNMDMAYDQMGEYFVAGKLTGQVYTMNLANKGWYLATPFRHVDPDVQSKVMDLAAKVAAKQIDIEKI